MPVVGKQAGKVLLTMLVASVHVMAIVRLLLAMSGDVEENPGPLSQHTKGEMSMSLLKLWLKYKVLSSLDPLDVQCSEDHIHEISKFSMNWKMLGKRLIGVQTTEDIDREEHIEQNKRDKMLEKWLEMNGSKATYKALINALQRIENVKAAEAVQRLALSIVIEGRSCHGNLT